MARFRQADDHFFNVVILNESGQVFCLAEHRRSHHYAADFPIDEASHLVAEAGRLANLLQDQPPHIAAADEEHLPPA